MNVDPLPIGQFAKRICKYAVGIELSAAKAGRAHCAFIFMN